MRTLEPVAVTVLTGFLGAGKTTLLNRLLRDPGLENTAVIVNEFGEIAIDHLLVEQATEGLIELSDGCLCCTVRGDLVDTLATLLDRMQTGRIAPLDRIIIETTGLADPVPVLQALIGHPVLAQLLRLDGVVTVVDVVNGAATFEAHAESLRQAAIADRLVLSKLDMAEPAAAVEMELRLRTINPNARILDVGEAGVATLFDCGLYDPVSRRSDLKRWLGPASEADHAAGHHEHHDHAHGPHDHRVRSFSLVHDRPISAGAIETFLDLLRSSQGDGLLRMKGVVELAEDPHRPLVLHAVQKLMHPPARLPSWPDGIRGTRLVLIGFDLDEEYVRRLFAAVTGAPAVDAPDRAALMNNPLSIAGFG